eukprot:Colp12_sorted_trinity150504_noHs@4799
MKHIPTHLFLPAGFGLKGLHINPYDEVAEVRGISWSIGGDGDYNTVPNFIKRYNPDVKGFSIGDHLVETCNNCTMFKYRPQQDRFNGALSFAGADYLDKQVDYVVEQVKTDPTVNFEEDWKLMTIFIGANDVCACEGIEKLYASADRWEAYVRGAVEKVRVSMPRVFVNLVELFNISGVYDISQKRDYCRNFHAMSFFECKCGFAPSSEGGDAYRRAIADMSQEYNARLRKIANDYKGQYRDFGVVAQPAFRDAELPALPVEFLSNIDCFHPSPLGHAQMAMHLWNNMVSPHGAKSTKFNVMDSFVCPTEETRIYTD